MLLLYLCYRSVFRRGEGVLLHDLAPEPEVAALADVLDNNSDNSATNTTYCYSNNNNNDDT